METVLDKVGKTQRVQGLLGQVGDYIVMGSLSLPFVIMIAVSISAMVGLRSVVGNRGVLQMVQG